MFNPFKKTKTQKKLIKLSAALGVLTKKSVLTFGKYNTRTVKQVLQADPEYLCWIHDNTKFKLHSSLISEARELAAKKNLDDARRGISRRGGTRPDDDYYSEWEEVVDCGPFW